jgi:hypothetical protein
LEKNLDSICGPHRDTSTEEIGIFGPHWTRLSERCGEYRPVTFISAAQTLASAALKGSIEFQRDGLD